MQMQWKFTIRVQENQGPPPTSKPIQLSPSQYNIQINSAPIQSGSNFRSRSIAQIVTWKAENDRESRRNILI